MYKNEFYEDLNSVTFSCKIELNPEPKTNTLGGQNETEIDKHVCAILQMASSVASNTWWTFCAAFILLYKILQGTQFKKTLTN